MRGFANVLMLMLAGLLVSCSRRVAVNGQSNVSTTFFAMVVDETGNPLPNAQFVFRIESIPKDWTFENRDRDNDVQVQNVASDLRGRLNVSFTGCKLILLKAEKANYRYFKDDGVDDSSIRNGFFRVISWGDLVYKK